MTREERAIELRDLALPIVARHGAWETVTFASIPGARMRLRVYRDSEFTIAYRTPFQRIPKCPMPPATDLSAYDAAALAQHAPRELPYGMDIWSGGKVLNIGWADDGRVAVHGYTPGGWERRLRNVVYGQSNGMIGQSNEPDYLPSNEIRL